MAPLEFKYVRMGFPQHQGRLSPIPEADGLRAVAATLVFLYHVHKTLAGDSSPESRFLIENLIYGGATGVTLFFLLSGFLLARPFLLRGIRSDDAITFLKNRFLRIYPMFIFVVLAATLISTADNHYWMGLKALFLIFDGPEFNSFSFPWWTLRTEFQFYFLMTLMLISFHNLLLRALFFLSVILLSLTAFLAYLDYFPLPLPLKLLIMQSAIAYLPVFLLGTTLSFIHIRLQKRKLLAPRFYFFGDMTFVVLIYFLCLILNEVSIKNPIKMEITHFSHHYIEALCWGGILTTIIMMGSNVSRFFSAKIIRWLGDISYSFYLVHAPIIFYCYQLFTYIFKRNHENHIDFLIVAAVSFIISVLLARLCYVFIEKPFLKLKAKN